MKQTKTKILCHCSKTVPATVQSEWPTAGVVTVVVSQPFIHQKRLNLQQTKANRQCFINEGSSWWLFVSLECSAKVRRDTKPYRHEFSRGPSSAITSALPVTNMSAQHSHAKLQADSTLQRKFVKTWQYKLYNSTYMVYMLINNQLKGEKWGNHPIIG